MILISGVVNVDENFDNILVGRIFGTTTLGTYAVAFNLATLPQRHLAYTIAG